MPVYTNQLRQDVENLVRENNNKLKIKKPHRETEHSWRVADYALINYGVSEEQRLDEYLTALLHDEVEDGLCTWEDLEAIGVPGNIIEALKILTRVKGDKKYQRYVDKVVASGNQLAITVKIYDIYDHLHPVRFNTRGTKGARYVKALEKLTGSLPRECEQCEGLGFETADWDKNEVSYLVCEFCWGKGTAIDAYEK